MWRWDGPPVGGREGADRRRWKSDQRRSTDRPFDERVALHRIRELAESLATVTNSYHKLTAALTALESLDE